MKKHNKEKDKCKNKYNKWNKSSKVLIYNNNNKMKGNNSLDQINSKKYQIFLHYNSK